METYCSALLNQEKSLEELQRHLRTTEVCAGQPLWHDSHLVALLSLPLRDLIDLGDWASRTQDLFRESVKRKNQQLDLLQSEVRRLKTSVGVRDEAASLQIDAALNAQAGELRRAKEMLADRDSQVDKLTKEVVKLKTELADAKARNAAERARADEASQSQGQIARHEEELQSLRAELSQVSEHAQRLQAAQAEAEAALEARDAQLAAMREREEANLAGSGAVPGVSLEELASMRERADEAENARIEAEEKARALEERLGEREQTMHIKEEEFQKEIAALRSSTMTAASNGSAADAAEKRALQAQVDELQKQLAAAERAAEQKLAAAERAAEQRVAAAERAAAEQAVKAAAAVKVAAAPTPPPSRPAPAPAPDPGAGAALAGAMAAEQDPDEYSDEEPEPELPPPSSGAAAAAEPSVRSLVVAGDAVVGARLTAQVDFIGCDSSKCQYSWYRGGALVHEGQPFYVPTFDDIGHDLEVRVTPVGKFPDGQARVGEAKSGSSSSPIALPDDVQKMVVGWVEIGQRRFEGLLELDKGSEKDRQLLFEKQKVKLRDGKGTTLSKPDDYKGVSIKFDKDPRTFTLIISLRKGSPTSHMLKCKDSGMRDLIAMTLKAFTNLSQFQSMPISTPSGSPNSALHLAAAGQITGAKPEGGGGSPASSMTSEQQSLADVDDPHGPPPPAGAPPLPKAGKTVTSKLSFGLGRRK